MLQESPGHDGIVSSRLLTKLGIDKACPMGRSPMLADEDSHGARHGKHDVPPLEIDKNPFEGVSQFKGSGYNTKSALVTLDAKEPV